MRRQRTDLEPTIVLGLQVLQVGYPGYVNEGGGTNQPEVHHRNQTLTAGQQLGLVAQLAQLIDGVLHRGRPTVLEGGWFHCLSPLLRGTCFPDIGYNIILQRNKAQTLWGEVSKWVGTWT